jgi:hypothetical protein
MENKVKKLRMICEENTETNDVFYLVTVQYETGNTIERWFNDVDTADSFYNYYKTQAGSPKFIVNVVRHDEF